MLRELRTRTKTRQTVETNLSSIRTFLDFGFLRTLPEAQIRNGFAELIKISSCADLKTFNALDKYCEEIIGTAFGRTDDASPEVRKAADTLNRDSIHEMLKL